MSSANHVGWTWKDRLTADLTIHQSSIVVMMSCIAHAHLTPTTPWIHWDGEKMKSSRTQTASINADVSNFNYSSLSHDWSKGMHSWHMLMCVHVWSYSAYGLNMNWFLSHACGTVCGGPSLHPRSTYDQSSNPEDEDILTVQWPYWFCHRFDFDINDQYGLFMNSWCLWIIHETRYQRMDQLGMVKTFAACETIGSIWYKSHRSNDLYRLSIFADLFIHEFNVSVMLCLVTETKVP